jgi:hypothetical protein
MTEKRRGWEANPPEVYAGIPGPASAYSHLGKKAEQQIPQEQVVKDLIDLLKRMPLSEAQVEEIYITISNRANHRVCAKCNRLKVVFGGKWEIHPSLDLTMPKTFICKECA